MLITGGGNGGAGPGEFAGDIALAHAVIAVAYLLPGLIMFAVPGWSAHHFPWKMPPFGAMTIGGDLPGSAWMAGIVYFSAPPGISCPSPLTPW